MRQYLIDAAAQHHIAAERQRHQPIGHAINCARHRPVVGGRLAGAGTAAVNLAAPQIPAPVSAAGRGAVGWTIC